jgi:hypothetical protein
MALASHAKAAKARSEAGERTVRFHAPVMPGFRAKVHAPTALDALTATIFPSAVRKVAFLCAQPTRHLVKSFPRPGPGQWRGQARSFVSDDNDGAAQLSAIQRVSWFPRTPYTETNPAPRNFQRFGK